MNDGGVRVGEDGGGVIVAHGFDVGDGVVAGVGGAEVADHDVSEVDDQEGDGRVVGSMCHL